MNEREQQQQQPWQRFANRCPHCGTEGYSTQHACPDCGHCEHVRQFSGTCVQCGETLYEIGEPVG